MQLPMVFSETKKFFFFGGGEEKVGIWKKVGEKGVGI